MSDLEQKDAEAGKETVTFGTWLKNQRLAKKVPLEEIAAVTKIHLSQLRALEDGWAGPMPASTFIRGFIVSYARHLGLNEPDVLEKFHQHSSEFKERSTVAKVAPPPTYNSNSGKPLRFGSYSERKDQTISHWVSTKRLMYAVIALVILGVIMFLIKLGKHAGEEAPPANVPAATQEMNPQPMQTKVLDQSASSAPGGLFAGNPPYDITLMASADCWINLKVDENSLESFKLGSGQTRKIIFNRKAKVTLSNPAGVKFEVNDITYRATATSGSAETFSFPDQASRLVAVKPKAAVGPAPSAPAQ